MKLSIPVDFEKQSNLVHTDCLISVQNLSEFNLVIRSDVDIVDLKDPSSGALAATNFTTWKQIADRYQDLMQRTQNQSGSKLPALSAALGEIDEALVCASKLPEVFAFAKAGPVGCLTACQLVDAWRTLRDKIHRNIELVAVAYADWELAGTLHPKDIFQLAADHGFKRCLIDTYTKDGRSTLDFLGADQVSHLRRLTQQHDLWFAFAGSIKQRELEKLNELGVVPDCYAVRGVVCPSQRSSQVCEDLLTRWLDLIRRNESQGLIH